MRFTFDPFYPDGSPRKYAGQWRAPYQDVLKQHTSGTGWMPTYELPAFDQKYLSGRFDKPLFELDADEES